jgi:alkyl sulfatase BDS1-like metallo-beta-lactamase superfamily hydrolase
LLGGTLEGIEVEGDASVVPQLMAVLQSPDPDFAIVTP